MKSTIFSLATIAALAIGTASFAQQAVIGWGGFGNAQATSGTIQNSEIGAASAIAGIGIAASHGQASGNASAFGVGVGSLSGVGGGLAGATHNGVNTQVIGTGALGGAISAGTGSTVQENSGIGAGNGFGGFGLSFK